MIVRFCDFENSGVLKRSSCSRKIHENHWQPLSLPQYHGLAGKRTNEQCKMPSILNRCISEQRNICDFPSFKGWGLAFLSPTNEPVYAPLEIGCRAPKVHHKVFFSASSNAKFFVTFH